MARDRLAEGVRLIRLHVDEEEGRRLAAPLEVELAREPPLEERDGGEERHADAERHRHPDRLAPGAGQRMEPLAPREGARAREPPREPPGGPRGEDEEAERPRGRPEEDGADPERARLPERERGQSAGHGGAGRPGPARPHAPGVDRVPEQDRRRHGTRGEKRPEREQERRQAPGQESGRHRPGRGARLEVEGDERLEQRPERELGGGAEGRAREAPERAEGERLDDVHRGQRPRARPEAAEDGDRPHLSREERAHGGRHADAADEQARDAHQPKVGGELVEEAPEPGLSLVEGGDAHGGVRHRLDQGGPRRAGLEPGGETHERPVPHAAAEPDEPRRVEARGVQEHARPEREEGRRAIGLLPDHAGHGEDRVADGERVAGRETEPPEDGFLDHDASAGEELVERLRGHGVEPPVEGIAAVDRLQLDEERAAPGGAPCHRHQLLHPGHGRAAPREVPDRRLRRGIERAPRAQLDVTPEQGARLAAERAVERRGHAQDRHERAYPERDAREEAGEVPPRAARLPPGEARDQTPGESGGPGRGSQRRRPHAAARSPTTRPSRSSTIRSA